MLRKNTYSGEKSVRSRLAAGAASCHRPQPDCQCPGGAPTENPVGPNAFALGRGEEKGGAEEAEAVHAEGALYRKGL